MGALHEGHASLIRLAREKADYVVTTIFVNPAQFAPGEDFSRYPRNLAGDTAIATSAGSDALFTPSVGEMYPNGSQTFVHVEELSTLLEGKSRPTHFRGVTTIVAKLFHCTKPHFAVFGQKDAQQVVIIKKMAQDLNFDVQIIVGPIVREPDGLAMSSRNMYLTPAERKESTVLYRALQSAEQLIKSGERDPSAVFQSMRRMIAGARSASIDYLSIADQATLRERSALELGDELLISLAVRIGTTRLIDNCVLTVPAK
jgi:pantoate--beta-alanine ligase